MIGVALAILASFAANAFWYLFLFPNAYLQSLGKTPDELAEGPSMVLASAMQLIGMAITATVLLYLVKRTGSEGLAATCKLGLILWVGLVGAVLAPMHAYQAYGLVFFAITSGGVLLTILISSAILGAMSRG